MNKLAFVYLLQIGKIFLETHAIIVVGLSENV